MCEITQVIWMLPGDMMHTMLIIYSEYGIRYRSVCLQDTDRVRVRVTGRVKECAVRTVMISFI